MALIIFVYKGLTYNSSEQSLIDSINIMGLTQVYHQTSLNGVLGYVATCGMKNCHFFTFT